MLKLQRQGRIGTFALNSEQEAAQVGAGLAMGDKDWLVPSFREGAIRMMRGVPLVNDLLFYNGFEECCWMAKVCWLCPSQKKGRRFNPWLAFIRFEG